MNDDCHARLQEDGAAWRTNFRAGPMPDSLGTKTIVPARRRLPAAVGAAGLVAVVAVTIATLASNGRHRPAGLGQAPAVHPSTSFQASAPNDTSAFPKTTNPVGNRRFCGDTDFAATSSDLKSVWSGGDLTIKLEYNGKAPCLVSARGPLVALFDRQKTELVEQDGGTSYEKLSSDVRQVSPGDRLAVRVVWAATCNNPPTQVAAATLHMAGGFVPGRTPVSVQLGDRSTGCINRTAPEGITITSLFIA